MKTFIVDVETTGTDPVTDRVIEIGVVVLDDFQVKETFSSLVNPHRPIPGSIQQLTGINDQMVRNAPAFEELTAKLDDLLKNRVFIAQNVMFDHGFLVNEFRRAGMTLETDQLICSRDLSMSIWPGSGSHRLASISSRLNHLNKQPHRALPDAQVLSEFLKYIHQKHGSDTTRQILQRCVRSRVRLSRGISKKLTELPESTGVYYLLDTYRRPLYIGKAKNIRQRVRDHFSGRYSNSSLISRSNETVSEIKFNITYDERLASILEDHEIRQHWPRFNSAQKRPVFKYSVYNYFDRNQTGRIRIIRSVNSKSPVFYFKRSDAERHVSEKVSKYSLSGNLCGVGLPEENCTDTSERHISGFSEYLKASSIESEFIELVPGKIYDEEENFLIVRSLGHTVGIAFFDTDIDQMAIQELMGGRCQRYFRINPGPVVDLFTEKLIQSGSLGTPINIPRKSMILPEHYSNLPATRSRYNHSLFF